MPGWIAGVRGKLLFHTFLGTSLTKWVCPQLPPRSQHGIGQSTLSKFGKMPFWRSLCRCGSGVFPMVDTAKSLTMWILISVVFPVKTTVGQILPGCFLKVPIPTLTLYGPKNTVSYGHRSFFLRILRLLWFCIRSNFCFLEVRSLTSASQYYYLKPAQINQCESKDLPLREVALLLPDYDIYPIFVEPSDCGHAGINRTRVYAYCVHRETGVYLHDLYDLYASITKLIKQTVATQVQDTPPLSDSQILR